MAFNGINLNFFGGAPTINVTNFNFTPPPETAPAPTTSPPPAVEEPPVDEDDDPAFVISFSQETRLLIEATGFDPVEEPAGEVDDPELGAVSDAGDEPAVATEETPDASARLQQFREEVFEITSSNRFSRPEQAILSRVFQATEFEFSAEFESDEDGFSLSVDIDIEIELEVENNLPPGLANGRGNAFGIQRRLLDLFQSSLSEDLLAGQSFGSLEELFESFRPEAVEDVDPTDDSTETA